DAELRKRPLPRGPLFFATQADWAPFRTDEGRRADRQDASAFPLAAPVFPSRFDASGSVGLHSFLRRRNWRKSTKIKTNRKTGFFVASSALAGPAIGTSCAGSRSIARR